MNYINKIPKFQRKKAIPKPLKDLELHPLNDQFSKLTMSIVGDDFDFRAVMTGNFFDMEKKKIVSTDAHKLTAINMPNRTFDFIKQAYKKELDKEPRGLIFHTLKQLQKDYNELVKIAEKHNDTDFQTFDEFVNFRAIQDGRYPNYEAVIPKEFTNEINVDYQKLYWYAKVLVDAKVIDDITKINSSNENDYQNKKIEYLKDSYVSFLNSSTKQIILSYTLDSTIQYISFNAKLLCDLLKFAMEFNGKTFGKVGLIGNSRAMVIELENGLNVINDSVGLIMPTFLRDDETIGNIDFDLSVAMYYDLDTNSIISDNKNYPIDEEIGFIPINTGLSTPKKRVKEQVSKVGKNPSEFNVGDIIEYAGVLYEVKNPKTKDNFSLLINLNDTYRKGDIDEFANTEYTKVFTLVKANEVKTLSIDDRIKGLKIVLKLAKGDKKTLIEKRIKGLEIVQKMSNPKTSVAEKMSNSKVSEINIPKKEQTAKKLAQKLMDIKDKVFDSLNINSGSELYEDIEIQKKFVDAMKVEIDNANIKEYLNLFSEDIFNILEDNNYHSLNNFLVLGKYITYPTQYNYYINSAIEYPKSSLQPFDIDKFNKGGSIIGTWYFDSIKDKTFKVISISDLLLRIQYFTLYKTFGTTEFVSQKEFDYNILKGTWWKVEDEYAEIKLENGKYLICLPQWNRLEKRGILEENDTKNLEDWRPAHKSTNCKWRDMGSPYGARYMYSQTYDQLRYQNQGEWYSYGSVSDTFGKGGMVEYFDYKDIEIMYQPTYEEYFVNDLVFNTLEKAKKYIDSGEANETPTYIQNLYRKGAMAKGGSVKNGYMVFNYTDNLYATNEVFKTKNDAKRFVDEFKKRFVLQGYYRDSNMNKIDITTYNFIIANCF